MTPIVALAGAISFAFPNVAFGAANRFDTPLLTPETMESHGFSITCSFIEHTVNERGALRPTGTVEVRVSFNAEKGSAIRKINAVHVHLSDEREFLLYVPVWQSLNPREKPFNNTLFVIQKSLLPKAKLWLLEQHVDPKAYLVDLNAFYKPKPAEKAKDASGGK